MAGGAGLGAGVNATTVPVSEQVRASEQGATDAAAQIRYNECFSFQDEDKKVYVQVCGVSTKVTIYMSAGCMSRSQADI